MKLWKITGIVEAIVAAEDYESAYDFARDAICKSVDDDQFEAMVDPAHLQSGQPLPDGWDGKCIPYGDGDGNTRIEAFLK